MSGNARGSNAFCSQMTPFQTIAPAGETSLLEAIAPRQHQLAAHPLYGSIRSILKLRIFLQSHVFAVWDFMSLLKALQQELTCVAVPWRPSPDPVSRRLINQIVLGEESDEYEGRFLSHFELYLQAMESCEADTAPVERLVSTLESGGTLAEALKQAPEEAIAFVRSTFAMIETGAPHRMAAAFTFGREDLIPEMFGAFIRELDARMPGQIAPFRYYLERHIEMDGGEHGPLALTMMRHLCHTNRQWAEARESACAALDARLELWDGIYARIAAAAE